MGPRATHHTTSTLVLVVALALTGCATGDRDSTSGHGSTPPNIRAVERLTAATGALVATWGDDESAFYVSMAALDAGYTTTQLVDAAVEGTVRAAGTIDGVKPERQPCGLLGDVVASRSPRPAQDVVVTASVADHTVARARRLTPADRTIAFVDASLGEMFRAAEGVLASARQEALIEGDVATSVTFLTLVLGARGYSPEQIVEAIVLGTAVEQPVVRPPEADPGRDPLLLLPCWQVTVDGVVLEPALPPALGIVCPRVESGSPPPIAPDDSDSEATPEDTGADEPDAAVDDARFEGTVRFSSDMLDASSPLPLAVAGITRSEIVARVADGHVTELRFAMSYAYQTCGQGDGTLGCTIDAAVTGTMAGGPIELTDGSAVVPLEVTVATLRCTGAPADCAAHPVTEDTSQATAHIALSGTTMTGGVSSDGFTAYEFDASR